ncbi:hypothetical protein CDAR_83851 [Caerostris darwini]|uniref:Uncharacterized protein n=1 Tax=Caerostris darwini TaxID=1538125 RepID=A0AAV4UQM8_9ARAC|nr:hypothetical protein CDAR_83851 [Caerostris darwini]
MREIFPSVSMHPISGFILPSPITCPILNLCSVPHRGAQAWRRKWVKEFPDESGSIPPFLISILRALHPPPPTAFLSVDSNAGLYLFIKDARSACYFVMVHSVEAGLFDYRRALIRLGFQNRWWGFELVRDAL